MAVILNYNSLDDTLKCLDYLEKQQGVDLKVCIVDNASSDGKQDELKKLENKEKIFVKLNSENKGFSAGNNIGLKKAVEEKCEYALIINPDVEIRNDKYVKELAAVMDEDKTIAVAGTDIVKADGRHQNPLREPYLIEELFWMGAFAKNKYSKKVPYVKKHDKNGCCKRLAGCCFMIDIKFVKDIGFLDEGTFLYSEESILAAQVKEKGLIEYYCADLLAYHMHKGRANESKEDLMKYSVKSRLYFIENYGCYGKIGDCLAKKVLKYRLKDK